MVLILVVMIVVVSVLLVMMMVVIVCELWVDLLVRVCSCAANAVNGGTLQVG